MKNRSYLLLMMLYSGTLMAQDFSGLWVVDLVTIGDEIMTPVAKWFDINENGTYKTGNGWLQNAEGTWTYDAQSSKYSPTETNGIVDPYGAFDLSLNSDQMTWKRIEDEMLVTVTLSRSKYIPKSPSNKIVGIWKLLPPTDQLGEYKPFDHLFLRWDREYRSWYDGHRKRGYWHIHGHRNTLTLLKPYNDQYIAERWAVSISKDRLTLVGQSSQNKDVELSYERRLEFPR